MPDHVHKLIELTGTSNKTMEDAYKMLSPGRRKLKKYALV